jgi:ribonuclease Z
MPNFELTILGTSSSQPAFGRFPTCQILQCGNNLYMIDCGEGSQIQLSKYSIKRAKIKVIFISHMHGDHVYGLPGVITSFMHYNRKDELIIVGPNGIKLFVDSCLAASQAHLGFPLTIQEFDTTSSQTLYSDTAVNVSSIPLYHGIPTMGFLFTEIVNYRRLNKAFISSLQLSHDEMKDLKKGIDVHRPDGKIVRSEDACLPINLPMKYAFLSDTSYNESVVPIIQNATVIYHETTYLQDMESEASARFHSTTLQAATIAKKANVGKLICGHYSSRYKSIDAFEQECRSIFTESYLGYEGLTMLF